MAQNIRVAEGRKVTGKYGYWVLGTPARGERLWHRFDQWHNVDGYTCEERSLCTGSHDLSAPAIEGLNIAYDAKCSSCWLHHGHTVDYHNQNITPLAS